MSKSHNTSNNVIEYNVIKSFRFIPLCFNCVIIINLMITYKNILCIPGDKDGD